jgi:hypothetical protein
VQEKSDDIRGETAKKFVKSQAVGRNFAAQRILA